MYIKIKLMSIKNKINKWVINNVASSDIISSNMRVKIYKLFNLNIKTNAIWPGCIFEGNNITIGKGTWINRGTFFDCQDSKILIGKNCGIGMQVLFCTSSHKIDNSYKRAGENIKLPISVGDGCWIGARSIILPGVKIGNGCVIAAGSVVTKNCDSNSLYAGIPAKKIKDLE